MPPVIFTNQLIEDATQQCWWVMRYSVDENYVVLGSQFSRRKVQVCELSNLIYQMQTGSVRHVLAVVNGEPRGPNPRDMLRLSLLAPTPAAHERTTRPVEVEPPAETRTTLEESARECFSLPVGTKGCDPTRAEDLSGG
jgi:hypothetical protein